MWCKFKSILEKLTDSPLDNEEKIFGLIDAPKKPKAYLRNFITFTIRHALINNRLNSIDEDSLTFLAEKTSREEIKYNYHHAKCHGKLEN